MAPQWCEPFDHVVQHLSGPLDGCPVERDVDAESPGEGPQGVPVELRVDGAAGRGDDGDSECLQFLVTVGEDGGQSLVPARAGGEERVHADGVACLGAQAG